jgi:uncharacterized cysteine cluster protein YcgN (CxxCxxCC family)
MLAKMFISSKYSSLLDSDTWRNDVLPELNMSSQILDSNIRETDYLDIQKDNILEHSYFVRNGCNWFEPCGICDQLKLYPNQINFLSLSIKIKSDKLKNLSNTKKIVDNFPTNCIQILMTYVMQLQKYIRKVFRTTPHVWLQTNIHSNTSLRNRHVISPHVGDWYEYIIKTKLWDYGEF